ncbi:hypothetical protein D9M68_750280 [compost metagenome]
MRCTRGHCADGCDLAGSLHRRSLRFVAAPGRLGQEHPAPQRPDAGAEAQQLFDLHVMRRIVRRLLRDQLAQLRECVGGRHAAPDPCHFHHGRQGLGLVHRLPPVACLLLRRTACRYAVHPKVVRRAVGSSIEISSLRGSGRTHWPAPSDQAKCDCALSSIAKRVWKAGVAQWACIENKNINSIDAVFFFFIDRWVLPIRCGDQIFQLN